MKIKHLLTDLDGVIRKFPPHRDTEIEAAAGLSPGTLMKLAFEASILSKVVCGEISDEDWRREIANQLAKICERAIAERAVATWSNFAGEVDFEYLEYVEAFFGKNSISILTNGTTRLNSDLMALGIDNRVSRVFNSADIGVCKPNIKIFEHVIKELGCRSEEVIFVDDSISHVVAARKAGLNVHHYESLDNFKRFLAGQLEKMA